MVVKQRGKEHVMSDERILGDSAFVEDLLSQADEAFERRYKLKRLGYDMDPDEFYSRGKQQQKAYGY